MSESKSTTASQINHVIREFVTDDLAALKNCFVELQEFERELVSHRLPGEEIAERYIQALLQRKKEGSAEIFVAEVDGKAVGFLSVLLSEKLDADLNEPIELAYLSDIVILKEYRKGGIGEALVKSAEKYAISKNAMYLSANVLANNKGGRALYGKSGFNEYELLMLKKLPTN
ncbi:MAG: GNAT family N-acetyltransferase [Candidatus Obscuribacterales bacterium]|nr:GNAT family N-acetyltransferase [Candidatus Obscuribacterales bacterium]